MTIKAKATLKSGRNGGKAERGHLAKGGELNLPTDRNAAGRYTITRNMATRDFFEQPLLREPLNWKPCKKLG